MAASWQQPRGRPRRGAQACDLDVTRASLQRHRPRTRTGSGAAGRRRPRRAHRFRSGRAAARTRDRLGDARVTPTVTVSPEAGPGTKGRVMARPTPAASGHRTRATGRDQYAEGRRVPWRGIKHDFPGQERHQPIPSQHGAVAAATRRSVPGQSDDQDTSTPRLSRTSAGLERPTANLQLPGSLTRFPEDLILDDDCLGREVLEARSQAAGVSSQGGEAGASAGKADCRDRHRLPQRTLPVVGVERATCPRGGRHRAVG